MALALAWMGTALLGNAEQIRVATWNLTWFPSGSPDPATPQQEEANIQAVASTLNGLQPDVIVLQEVRDSRACEQLALRLGPGSYQVNVCSAFRDGGGPAATRRQLAILSRFPAMAGWAEEWQAEGAVLPPGGWAFAALHWGATALGVFAVHLKSNVGLGERDTQLNILKRELCAEQLLRTVDGLSGRLTNRLDALVVAGNFNTDLDQARFVSERTLRALLEADFSHGFDGVPLAERVTIPGQGRYADATFDYIFARGGSFVARPEIVRTEWSDHFVVAADLAVTPPPPPPLPALAPTVEAPPSVSPAVVSTLAPVGAQPHVNWPLWAFLFVLLGLHLAIWQAVRARKAVAVGSRKTRETSATEDCGLSEAGDRIIVPLRTAEKLQPALGATETGPRGVHPEPPPATAVVRSHLLPQLARLMVNRLVQGLLFQRARMMQAQETAAEHIHELEERLGRIQSQLQQRLSTYEQRIAELEKELAAKEQENRALLQAQQRVLRDAPAADKEKEPAVV